MDEALIEAWEEAMTFIITYRCRILITTFGQADKASAAYFPPQMAIFDEGSTITFFAMTSAIRKVLGSLKAVAIFGDTHQFDPIHDGYGAKSIWRKAEVCGHEEAPGFGN